MVSRDDACAKSSDVTSALPSILQLVVDTSGSMDWPPGRIFTRTSAGQALDPELVNVLYTPNNGRSETIGRDPSASACGEGWQYSADGKRIVLCGDVCARVQADATGQVEVLFGCQTVQAPKPK